MRKRHEVFPAWETHALGNDYGDIEITKHDDGSFYLRIYENSSTASSDLDITKEELGEIYEMIGGLLTTIRGDEQE